MVDSDKPCSSTAGKTAIQAKSTAITKVDSNARNLLIQNSPIQLIKTPECRWNVMRFNPKDFASFPVWPSAQMWREIQANATEKSTKRRYSSKTSSAQEQPWFLNLKEKTPKKFKGTRAGGIDSHSSYYIFKSSANGYIEAHPVEEFINFQQLNRYTPLTAEEAEKQYDRRKEVLNYFSIMTRKRLAGDEKLKQDTDEKDTEKKSSAFKIHDMDEWMSSSDCESSLDEVESNNKKKGESDDENAKKRKKRTLKESAKKKPQSGSKQDTFEYSDDGDNDGREMDYETDSTDGDLDAEAKISIKSVAEEDALRKLLTSDEDEDDEVKTTNEPKINSDDDNRDKSPKLSEKKLSKTTETSKNKKDTKKTAKSKKIKKRNIELEKKAKATISKSMTKRIKPTKQAKIEKDEPSTTDTSVSIANNDETNKVAKTISTEDTTMLFNPSVDKNEGNFLLDLEQRMTFYLKLNPLTTTQLLSQMKGIYTNMSANDLVQHMTAVLKKINPAKTVLNAKLYLSITERK